MENISLPCISGSDLIKFVVSFLYCILNLSNMFSLLHMDKRLSLNAKYMIFFEYVNINNQHFKVTFYLALTLSNN